MYLRPVITSCYTLLNEGYNDIKMTHLCSEFYFHANRQLQLSSSNLPVFGAFLNHKGLLPKLFKSTRLSQLKAVSVKRVDLSLSRSTYIYDYVRAPGHLQREVFNNYLEKELAREACMIPNLSRIVGIGRGHIIRDTEACLPFPQRLITKSIM